MAEVRQLKEKLQQSTLLNKQMRSDLGQLQAREGVINELQREVNEVYALL